ncbi:MULTISPECIES: hypothetical protein [unclassified Providencia]|uniref:hypothetical protein n=1 Tax=unclassified Providencia TaxID=2633465 RepID=UPI002349AA99|nr:MULTISPECIES: hypothetical protein [unclassified Providencia]HEP0304339.1 hypothetical protein [Providencia rettgeri]
MSNHKLYYYLNSEDEQQQELLAYLAEQKNRSQCVREALLLLKGMGQLDPSLPHLLLAIINSHGSDAELQRVLKMAISETSLEKESASSEGCKRDIQIIGYQCKKPDPYKIGNSDHWFPITEDVYQQEIANPSENTRVRAIYASLEGDNSRCEEAIENGENAPKKSVGVKNAAKLFK